MLRLRVARLSLEHDLKWGDSDSDRPVQAKEDWYRMRFHLRLIIQELFTFIQSGVVLPLLNEFKQKVCFKIFKTNVFTGIRYKVQKEPL